MLRWADTGSDWVAVPASARRDACWSRRGRGVGDTSPGSLLCGDIFWHTVATVPSRYTAHVILEALHLLAFLTPSLTHRFLAHLYHPVMDTGLLFRPLVLSVSLGGRHQINTLHQDLFRVLQRRPRRSGYTSSPGISRYPTWPAVSGDGVAFFGPVLLLRGCSGKPLPSCTSGIGHGLPISMQAPSANRGNRVPSRYR